jgi:hypothetical protein
VTHTWTIVDYASSTPSLSGDLLGNRLLWISLTALFCALSVPVFAFRARRTDSDGKRKAWKFGKAKWGWKKKGSVESASPSNAFLKSQPLKPQPQKFLWLTQAASITRFEVLCLSRSLAWRVLVLCGIAAAFFGVTQGQDLMGVMPVPGATAVAFAIDRSTGAIMTLLIVLFAGEVVWRERSTRMGLTLDALPSARGVMIAGKFLALAVFIFGTVSILALTSLATQMSAGGTPLPAHAVWIPVLHQSFAYLQLAAVALLLQIVAGGRLRGYLAMALFLSLRLGLTAMGYRGALYSVASVRLPFLSEMNDWSYGLSHVLLIQSYWTWIAACLLIVVALCWPHGVALNGKETLARALRRSTASVRVGLLLCILASIGTGLWVQQTTESAGHRLNPKEGERFRAMYEQEFQSWQQRPRPAVVAIDADVNLDPGSRHVQIRGRYQLENQQALPIQEVLFNFEPDFTLHELTVWRAVESEASMLAAEATPGTRILRFDPPLAPGESRELHFHLEFQPSGLAPRLVDNWFQQNGTYFLGGTGTHPFFQGGHFFPSLGYDSARELRSRKARERFDMPPWAPLISAAEYEQQRAVQADLPLGKASAQARPEVFGSSDWAVVELRVQTPADQIAIAPGQLLERKVKDGRAFHHFRTANKIQAFFSILSGRYEVLTEKHGNVRVEIYYHAAHEARVAHILWAVEQSLAYFEKHWGPYPQKVLRLGEIPGEAGFAASFPGVMAFGETMAFTCPDGEGNALDFPSAASPASSPSDVDPILWIVAHEVAHQWWDCHVLPGLALGASLASESLAQYGSLAVMQQVYGSEHSLRITKYNRDLYLRERSRAPRQERALMHVDDQAHLHYGKGMVAFHAMAEVVGYETIDRALATLVQECGGPLGRPITSIDLMQALQAQWPQQHKAMLHELLEQIAFVDSSITRAEVGSNTSEGYPLLVEGEVLAVTADGDGEEQSFDYRGELELLVLFKDMESSQRVRAQVLEGRVRFELLCEQRPIRVVLDPRLLHIDRNLENNETLVLEKP